MLVDIRFLSFLGMIIYLISSIPVSYIWIKSLKNGLNLDQVGTGNLGSSNTKNASGYLSAICISLIDIFLKGFLPIYVFDNISQTHKGIEIEVDNGTPVVVDGYERTPVSEWAKGKLPDYILKQPKPQGGGAPAGRSSGSEVPAGTKNPFAADTYNITEQMRIYRTDRDLYDRLKNQVKR